MTIDELRDTLEQDRALLVKQRDALRQRIDEYSAVLLKTEGGIEVIDHLLTRLTPDTEDTD